MRWQVPEKPQKDQASLAGPPINVQICACSVLFFHQVASEVISIYLFFTSEIVVGRKGKVVETEPLMSHKY